MTVKEDPVITKTPLQIVNKFLELTNDKKDIAGAAQLMAEGITFVGPAAQTSGVKEYIALLEQVLPLHMGWKVFQRFENGDNVCVIEDIRIKTPADEIITLALAEWYKVSNGKITEHKVYYDPREFMTAFGM